ncbi:MAG: alcohol dehydrogenase catalytic domain-containing protein [Caldilineaceae bacterium]
MNYTAQEPLPKTMQAVVCHGPRDYRLQEWNVPTPGKEEVVIRVDSVGICASDLKCYSGRRSLGRRQPGGLRTAAGDCWARVYRHGGGAGRRRGAKYGLALGDTAISEQIVPCWHCRYCRRGQYWMCQEHEIYGFRQKGLWRHGRIYAIPGQCHQLQSAGQRT